MVEANRSYRFGDFILDPSEHRLTRGKEEVHLRPKTFEVLCFLVRNHGHLVTKESLLEAVWAETYVSDKTLINSVSEIRDLMEDHEAVPKFIRTVPKVGYQFVAQVEETPAKVSKGWLPWRIAVVVLLTGMLFWIIMHEHPGNSTGGLWEIESIAVLPFASDNQDEEMQYMKFVLAERISSRLAGSTALRVVPMDRVRHYGNPNVDSQRAVRELEVDAVLSGILRKVEDQIVLHLELVDEESKLWGDNFNWSMGELFATEARIAEELVRELHLELTANGARKLQSLQTKSPEAYENFLKGRFHYREIGFDVGAEAGVRYLQQAVKEDPFFAAAYAELGDAHIYLGFHLTSMDHYDAGRWAVERALELDDSLGHAHLLMGNIRAYYDHDWFGAEASYRRASELDPNLRREYIYWIWMARRDLALQAIDLKLAESDRLSCHRQMRIGFHYYFAREFDRARHQAEVALKLDPDDIASRWLINLCNWAEGKEDLNFVAEDVPRWISHLKPETATEIFRAGGKGAIFEESTRDPNWPGPQNKPWDNACRYAVAGEEDKAFEWLRRAYEFPLLIPFFAEARLDSLREDPRYEELLHQFNLPEDVVALHLAH